MYKNEESLEEIVKKSNQVQFGGTFFDYDFNIPADFGSVSLVSFFIFEHGLNHPEMQRNHFSPLGDPPLPQASYHK